jgi:hypothetical protein
MTRSDLDLIRDIRNSFAHSRRAISFSAQEVADVCDLLHAYKIDQTTEEDITSAKKKYVDSCYMIAIRIVVTDAVEASDSSRARVLP